MQATQHSQQQAQQFVQQFKPNQSNLFKNFTLYVCKTPACQRILQINQEAHIKTVVIQDRNYPQFLTGVPSIADFATKTVYQGKDAFKTLRAIASEVQRTQRQQHLQKNQQHTHINPQESQDTQQTISARPQKSSLLSLNTNAATTTEVPGMQCSSISSDPKGKITEREIEDMLQERNKLIQTFTANSSLTV